MQALRLAAACRGAAGVAALATTAVIASDVAERGGGRRGRVTRCHGRFNDAYSLLAAPALGTGASGSVLLARHRQTGAHVAVKTVERAHASLSTAREELDCLRELKHPNIIRLHDNELHESADGDKAYIVMELARGGELWNRLTEEMLDEPSLARVLRDVASAVEYIHQRGIIHLDLKPENILLDESGRAILSDFGSARRLRPGRAEPISSKILYTACYSAPEVISGGAVDEKADVWALGVLLYVLLRGLHPFDASGDASEEQIVERILSEEPDLSGEGWEGVDPDAVALCGRMLSKRPQDRPAAEEVLSNAWLRRAVDADCCDGA